MNKLLYQNETNVIFEMYQIGMMGAPETVTLAEYQRDKGD